MIVAILNVVPFFLRLLPQLSPQTHNYTTIPYHMVLLHSSGLHLLDTSIVFQFPLANVP